MAMRRCFMLALLTVGSIASGTQDVVVVGGGPAGLAAAVHSKKLCPVCSVTLLEAEEFFNQDGSTTGASRQTRIAYTTRDLTKLAVEATKRFDALEAEVGVQLVQKSGMLWFGNPNTHGSEGQIDAAVKVLDQLGLPHETLNASQLIHRFPLSNLPPDYIGLFTAGAGGTIHVARTLEAYHSLALKLGVRLVARSPVQSFQPVKEGAVVVLTNGTKLHTKKLILCVGAYTNRLLVPLKIAVNYTLWEWSTASFTVTDDRTWQQQPIWIRFENASPHDGGMFYGFPDWHALGEPGTVRVNPGYGPRSFTDPKQRSGKPDLFEMNQTREFVREHLQGIDADSMQPSNQTGLANLIGADGNAMVLSFLPASVSPYYKNVVVNTAGWGFKLIPLLGDMMAQLALHGNSSMDISQFEMDQPGYLIHL